MSSSSRYVLFALLGCVFFIGAVYLVLQFDILAESQDDVLENSITYTANKTPEVAEVNEATVEKEVVYEEVTPTTETTTIVDSTYGFSLDIPSDWSVFSQPGGIEGAFPDKLIFVSFAHIDEMEDMALEDWVGLGDGYGSTVDTFAEDRDRVATEDTAPTISQKTLGPVVTLDNGYRAKVYVGGNEGTILEKRYTMYKDDIRISLSINPGDSEIYTDAAQNTVVVDSSDISDTSPLEIRALFDEFDSIVASIDLTDFVYEPQAMQ